jgi:hypothetical protein
MIGSLSLINVTLSLSDSENFGSTFIYCDLPHDKLDLKADILLISCLFKNLTYNNQSTSFIYAVADDVFFLFFVCIFYRTEVFLLVV